MVRAGLMAMILLACTGPIAHAEEPRMVTEAEAPQWVAVGRLNVAGNRSCTATLVSPTEAITAAHCLFHPVTRHRAEAGDIRFVIGFRRDSYAALVGVSAVAVMPLYQYGGIDAQMSAISQDLALLRLDRVVLPGEAAALPVADWPPGPATLTIVGYGRDRPLIASIRTDCPYLDEAQGVKLLDCPVVPGLSGAPVLLDGQVVAVVSTSVGTRVKGEQALVLPIAQHLAELRSLLK